MKELFTENTKGAIISDCGKYRYQLWRIWDDSKPKVMFMMCNPSTANADKDDPTIRRCIGFAKTWGYGGLYVGNLFAFRSSNPKDLLNASDPIGKENLKHIAEMRDKSQIVVLAWGNSPIVESLLSDTDYAPLQGMKPFFLELSKNGTPKHPLYLKKELVPKQFKIRFFNA